MIEIFNLKTEIIEVLEVWHTMKTPWARIQKIQILVLVQYKLCDAEKSYYILGFQF